MFAACVAAFVLGANPATGPREKEWEMTSQLSSGGGVRYDSQIPGAQGLFSTALRMDMIFGRRPPNSWGAGWFVSSRTDNFRDLAVSGGLSVLIPASDTFPFVLSVGTAGRYDSATRGVSFGTLERLWWGPRSMNFEGHYVLSAGIFVESRQFFDPFHTVDVIFGLDFDLELTAIPFMALYTWIFRTDPKAQHGEVTEGQRSSGE